MADNDERGRFTKGNSYRIKKGEVLNPKGRPKGRSLHDRLRAILDDPENGERIVEELVMTAINAANDGDFRFWKEIVERIDGKVPQRLSDADGGSLTFVIEEAVQSPRDDD